MIINLAIASQPEERDGRARRQTPVDHTRKDSRPAEATRAVSPDRGSTHMVATVDAALQHASRLQGFGRAVKTGARSGNAGPCGAKRCSTARLEPADCSDALASGCGFQKDGILVFQNHSP